MVHSANDATEPNSKPVCVAANMTGINGTHKVPGKGGVWGGV